MTITPLPSDGSGSSAADAAHDAAVHATAAEELLEDSPGPAEAMAALAHAQLACAYQMSRLALTLESPRRTGRGQG